MAKIFSNVVPAEIPEVDGVRDAMALENAEIIVQAKEWGSTANLRFEDVTSKILFPNSGAGYVSRKSDREISEQANNLNKTPTSRSNLRFSMISSHDLTNAANHSRSQLKRQAQEHINGTNSSFVVGWIQFLLDRIRDAEFVWLYLLLLGFGTGILGFFMDYIVHRLLLAKRFMSFDLVSNPLWSFILWVAFTVIVCMIASIVTRINGGYAVGSGIPEMRCVLAGIAGKTNNYLSLSTLVLKIISLTLALGSGMWIGKEGPFVHIAAVIASQLLRFPIFKQLSKELSVRRQMISVGCAAGVAANFGSPIGGVLFSIEVTSHYYATKGYFRAFFASLIAGITFTILASIFILNHNALNIFVVPSSNTSADVDMVEFALFALMGVIFGVLGAVFNYAIGISIKLGDMISNFRVIEAMEDFLRRQLALFLNLAVNTIVPSHTSFEVMNPNASSARKNRTVSLIIVAAITAVVTYPYLFGEFMSLSQSETINHMYSETVPTQSGWYDNGLFVSIMFCFVLHFILTTVSVTLPISCGIFLPALVMGGLVGRFYGELIKEVLTRTGWVSNLTVDPLFYALAGSAGFAAGVTRTVSSALIVCEITGSFTFVLPILLTAITAMIVGSLLSPPIYDYLAELNNLPFLSKMKKKWLDDSKVNEIVSGCYFLTNNSTYKDALELINYSAQMNFPIVDNADDMNIIGSVNRYILMLLLRKYLRLKEHSDDRIESLFLYYGEALAKEGNLWRAVRSKLVGEKREFKPTSSRKIDDFEFHKEAEEDLNSASISYTVDGEELMDTTPHFVEENTSLGKFHHFFTILNLEYCYITHTGRLVGIIEREDLLEFVTENYYS